MDLIVIIKDAIRYTASDWRNFLILGLILFLTDHIIDLSAPPILGDWGDVLILLIIIVLSFMEVGYGFRIVEETVKGSTRPPSFHHPLHLFWHGVKESLVLVVYFLLPLILVAIGISEFELVTNQDFSPLITEYSLLIAIILFICFNVMLQGAILTMAHHSGGIRWGFNLPLVFKKIKLVGLKNMLMVSGITIVVLYIVKQIIFDTLHGLPYLGSTVGDVISTVLIAPFLMIFTTRLVGLIDVSET